jgi:hypothetical protein
MGLNLENLAPIPDLTIPGGLFSSDDQVRCAIDRYISTQAVNDGYPQAGDIEKFFPVLQKVLHSRQHWDGIAENKRLLVVMEDPPELVDTEAITFYLQSRTPGSFERTTAGQIRGGSGTKEVVAHKRSEVAHPEHLGEKLITMGKYYDNLVAINVYARTDKQAFNRLLWLEKAIDSYTWFFRMHGFRVIEKGVEAREKTVIGDLLITRYPVYYLVRTEDVYHYGSQELKHVSVSVDASTSD